MESSTIRLASTTDCTACAACVSVCPKRCISMHEDKEGFLQPEIDASVCIECHKCEKVCPVLNQEITKDDFETKAYAVINKDDEVRAQSSSGGVFFPLAKWVIEQGGVVFGARWNDKWEVVHDYAEDLDGVKAFMRSKYVQSVVGDTLRQAKQFLDAGRWVLYSGTPCQLGGLRAYLGKEYERLIQVDLICHGVPSPGVWRSYLKEYFGKEKIVDINFRDKSEGWTTSPCVSILTEIQRSRCRQMDNPFYKGFILRVYQRNSCHTCNYRQFHRASDITIADFWGVSEVCPEMHDDKGTSIVFAHTEKGSKILCEISTVFRIKEQEKIISNRYNPSMVYNQPKPLSRNSYWFIYRLLGFRKSEFAISKDNILKRVVRKLKRSAINT